MMAFEIPPGYRLVRTDEPVGEMGRRYFYRRALALSREHPPLIQSYHYRIEKVGFLKYAVVSYQNKLEPVEAT